MKTYPCLRRLAFLAAFITCSFTFARFAALGAIVYWGDSALLNVSWKPKLADALDLAAGYEHVLAVRTNGTVAAWGANYYGQSSPPEGLTNAVAVAGGLTHSLALLANGRVVGWGDNSLGQILPPADLRGVKAIAAGGYHSLAVRSNGTVVAWGDNGQGQAEVPTGLAEVRAIAAGRYFSLALCSNGAVRAWGFNGYGQLDVPEFLTNAIAIGAGHHHALAVTTDGRVVQWGAAAHGQGTPPELTNAVAVAGGLYFSLALRQDGSVVQWTRRETSTMRHIPNPAFPRITALACGPDFAVALQRNDPWILEDLPDLEVRAGRPAIFSPLIQGKDQLYFLWHYNGRRMMNTSLVWNAQLVINSASAAHAGDYQLIVTNAYGAVTGRVATLRVHQAGAQSPPVMVQDPAGLILQTGEGGSLTAAAEGLQPIFYQWQQDKTDLPGATNATLQLANVTVTNAGWYRLVASNALGQSISAAAYVRVYGSLGIVDPPQPATFYVGTPFSLYAKLTNGYGEFSYYWVKNGQVVFSFSFANDGLFNCTLEYPAATYNMAGDYQLVLSNRYGMITSQTASIRIGNPAAPDDPGFLRQPGWLEVKPGDPILLTTEVTGAETLYFQWQREGENMAGATNRDLYVEHTQAIHYGGYRLIVSNHLGSVTSRVAQVGYYAPPYFYVAPHGILVRRWDIMILPYPIQFDARAWGSQPITYRWYCDGTNLTDVRFQTNLFFGTLWLKGPANPSYTNEFWLNEFTNSVFLCTASNTFGVITSEVLRVTIEDLRPPVIQAPAVTSPAACLLAMETQTGLDYAIEYSTNLTHWEVWTNFYSLGTATNFLWQIRSNQPQTYFRLVLPESP